MGDKDRWQEHGVRRGQVSSAQGASTKHGDPGLAAATHKMLQHMKTLGGKRKRKLKIKLHKVQEH